MTRKELDELRAKFDFEHVKEVSDKQAMYFDNDIGMMVATSLLDMFALKQNVKKKVDDRHVIQTFI